MGIRSGGFSFTWEFVLMGFVVTGFRSDGPKSRFHNQYRQALATVVLMGAADSARPAGFRVHYNSYSY